MCQANPLEQFSSLQNDKVENEFFQVICGILDLETRIYSQQLQLRNLAEKIHNTKDFYAKFAIGITQSVTSLRTPTRKTTT